MRALALFLSLAIAFSAFGDTVTLKSGRVVEGRVIQLRTDSIIVRLASGEVVKILEESIQWIGYSEAPEWQKPGVEIPGESEIKVLEDTEARILKETEEGDGKRLTLAEWERRGYEDGMRATCCLTGWGTGRVSDPPRIQEASPDEWEAYMLGFRNAKAHSRLQASLVGAGCVIVLLSFLSWLSRLDIGPGTPW